MALAENHEETETGFAHRLSGSLNEGFTALGTALGSKLGLFDLLISFDEPKTSHEIADAGGFKERYIREWLGLMVVSKIVNVDRETKKYSIPVHRHASLRTGCPGNGLAVYSWCVPMFAKPADELEECFKRDGPRGLPYDRYVGFHTFCKTRMAVGYTWEVVKASLEQIPGLIQKLGEGISVCDVGSSTGHVALTIGEKFPKSVIYGIDISAEAVAVANQDAKARGLDNVTFGVHDVCSLPGDWSNKWDLITLWHVAHDLPETSKALREVHRTMKPGGNTSMVDMNLHTEHADNIDAPMGRFIYGCSLFHCMPVSLHFEGGEGMGAAWGHEKATKMLCEAGFTDIKKFVKPHSSEMHYVLTKSAPEG